MGFFQSLSSVASVPAMRAGGANYVQDFWSGNDMPDSWISTLSAAGVQVTPDLAMTLSAISCGVRTIAYDIATLPLLTYRLRDDGGKELVRGRAIDVTRGGIADLAYMLRWAPNAYQTTTEYLASMIAQWLLRDRAYAEIVPGPSGFLEQLLPRHPARVSEERLPSGRLRYKLIEANGQPRYLTQDEMHVVRDIGKPAGGSGLSVIQYASNSLGIALSAERAAGRFFKSGMTASMMAAYKGGQMDDENEAALHRSISRYAAGSDNHMGLLLVPDDVTVSNLSVEPDKAQMMQARGWTVEEVARWLRISPRKLMARGKDAGGYASAYQDAIDHVVGCLRPVSVTFEQAMQRDLILAKDTYFVKFHLRELLQGDPAQLGDYISKLIASRAMTPSEARMLYLDLNPDAHLDQLAETDNKPGQPKPPAEPAKSAHALAAGPALSARAQMKGLLAIHDAAVRCVRRERMAVERLAKKHASDVDGWHQALRAFGTEHAVFVAETMRLSMTMARGVVAQQLNVFEAQGLVAIEGDAGAVWERHEADELAALAVSDVAQEVA